RPWHGTRRRSGCDPPNSQLRTGARVQPMRSNALADSDGSGISSSSAGRWPSLVAYLAIGLAWYAIFRVALSVRVGSRLWAPVSDGAWRQVMAIDVLRDVGLPRTGGALLAYG